MHCNLLLRLAHFCIGSTLCESSECSTEIILQQSKRPGLILALDCHHFMKCKEKLSKYESNEYNRSKSHIFNSEQKKSPLIIYLSQETINVANKMH